MSLTLLVVLLVHAITSADPSSIAAAATTGPGASTLDILVVPVDYTDSADFNRDLATSTDWFRNVEPFKGRSDQIAFWPSEDDTTSDAVDCHYTHTDVPSCSMDAILAIKQLHGEHADLVVLMVNQSFRSGAYPYFGVAIVSRVGYVGWTFTHELGHVIGGLGDEYVGSGAGNGPNCSPIAPNIAWADLVPENEYRLGCAIETQYRPSNVSIMSTAFPFFNSVSQRYLNEGLDRFAGRSPDDIPPTVSFTYLGAGQSVTGYVLLTPDVNDDRGIAWAQLWVDNRLEGISYLAPFSLYFPSSRYYDGKHSLKLRVSDGSGNTTDAIVAIVTVNPGRAIGDVNCDLLVTMSDLLDTLRYLSDVSPGITECTPEPFQLTAADVNRDGAITGTDALELLRILAGISNSALGYAPDQISGSIELVDEGEPLVEDAGPRRLELSGEFTLTHTGKASGFDKYKVTAGHLEYNYHEYQSGCTTDYSASVSLVGSDIEVSVQDFELPAPLGRQIVSGARTIIQPPVEATTCDPDVVRVYPVTSAFWGCSTEGDLAAFSLDQRVANVYVVDGLLHSGTWLDHVTSTCDLAIDP